MDRGAMDIQASRLRIISLFEDLSDAELAAIARSCTTRVYKRHAQISEVNDRTGDVFFILEGAVRANTVSVDGREVIYTDLGVGDIVGEFSAIDHQPRSSGMVATSDCLLARMTTEKFHELLHANSSVAIHLIQLLVAKIRRMSERVFEVSALAVRERVRRELLRMAADGTKEGRGAVIHPAPTHYEFAARIGSHREAVTRELNRLEAERVVEVSRREIRILDLRRLQDDLSE